MYLSNTIMVEESVLLRFYLINGITRVKESSVLDSFVLHIFH